MNDGAARFQAYNHLCIGVGLKDCEGEYRIVKNNISLNVRHGLGYDIVHENNLGIQFPRNIEVIDADHCVWVGKEANADYKYADANRWGR